MTCQPDRRATAEMFALLRRYAKQDLRTFARIFWQVVNPGVPMLWNWHLDAICDHLQAVSRRDIRRVAISVPPGSCKSTLVGQAWPCWDWLQHPERRWVFATNALDNAKKEAVFRRSIIQAPLFRQLSPTSDALRTKNILTVRNESNGVFRGISVGSSITGDHFDVQVIDDPNDAQRVSAEELDAVNFWYDNAFSSRKRDNSALVVIQQRLAPNDLIGHLLDVLEFDAYLCIPAQYDPKNVQSFSKLGWKDPRTVEGQLLWPERFGPEQLLFARKTLGEAGYRAQYQQRPMPSAAGVTFRRQWWHRWSVPPDDVINWVATVDTASSMRKGSDNSVVQVWALARGGVAYLMHHAWGHWDIQEKMRQISNALDLWPQCRIVAVEERGEGFAVAAMLQDALRPQGRDVRRWSSRAPKESRILVCAPLVESGHVVIPEGDQGDALIDEAAMFPEGDHDDMIDAMAMVCSIWSRELTGAAYQSDAARGGAPGVERFGHGTVWRDSNTADDKRIQYKTPRRANVGGTVPTRAPVWYR